MKIVIVDYGMGNVQSIFNAFHQFNNIEVSLSDKRDDILSADGIVLPGVGAFKKAMEELTERNLIEILREYSNLKKPFLGICLGMQLLFDSSEEFGYAQGLGLLEGKVERFPSDINDKLPHVSWNGVYARNIDWNDSILENISNGDDFYFVHSYVCVPKDKSIVLSTTEYGGIEFCSSIKHGNIYACQFHPEKSAASGIKVIENFINTTRIINEAKKTN